MPPEPLDAVPRPNPLGGVDLAPLVWASDSLLAAVLDGTGRILDANPTFARLARRDPRGEPIASSVSEGQVEAFTGWLRESASGWRTGTWGLLPDVDGMPRDVRVAACRGAGDVLVLVGEPLRTEDVATALIDVNEHLVTEHRRLERDRVRLDRVTREDVLTGVANRRAFDGRLARELERVSVGGSFCLVMLDIDHFKHVNDRFGHPAGDAVLRWLGAQLRASVRRGDLVARYGGEEFVAILTDISTEDAGGWAERLGRSIRSTPAPGMVGTVTVSMGVAAWQPGETGADCVARADRALYVAKEAGRDRCIIDDPASPTP